VQTKIVGEGKHISNVFMSTGYLQGCSE